MNIDTGEIKEIRLLSEKQKESGRWVECKMAPTPSQMYRGRLKGYEKCLCGSGKQFKNCCKRKESNQ